MRLRYCCLLLFFFVRNAIAAKGQSVEDIRYLEPLIIPNWHNIKRGNNLEFTSHERLFSLNLVPQQGLFHPGIKFLYHEGGQFHNFEYDTSNLFFGEGVVGEQRGYCSIRIDWEKKLLTGIVHTQNESFGIEPSHHFFDEERDFQSVIYKSSDVIHDGKCGNPAARQPLTSRVEKRQKGDTCTVVMVADSRLYEYYGSVVDTANNLVDTLAGAEAIYAKQSVSGFQLVSVVVFTDPVTDPFRSSSSNYQNFLGNLTASRNSFPPSDKCLIHARTYYDYEGILGYGSVGSICSYAAGITTANSFGKVVNMFTQINSVAHEIGHNFGSVHDPSGNYLMFSSLSDSINPEFSQASLQAIDNTLSTSSSCFITKSTAGIGFCGNGVLDAGEECDCGSKCSSSAFCTSSCKLISGAQCDPSNEQCCSPTGQFLPKGTTCAQSPYAGVSAPVCSGDSGKCPKCYTALTHPCDAFSNVQPCDLGPCLAACAFNGQTNCFPASAIGISAVYLPDGTCCPGGTCANGTCKQYGGGVVSGATSINSPTQDTQTPVSSKRVHTSSLVITLVAAVGGTIVLLLLLVSVIVVIIVIKRRRWSKYPSEQGMDDIFRSNEDALWRDMPPETPTRPTERGTY